MLLCLVFVCSSDLESVWREAPGYGNPQCSARAGCSYGARGHGSPMSSAPVEDLVKPMFAAAVSLKVQAGDLEGPIVVVALFACNVEGSLVVVLDVVASVM